MDAEFYLCRLVVPDSVFIASFYHKSIFAGIQVRVSIGLLFGNPLLFDKEKPVDEPTEDVEKLYAKIGQLEMANDFLKKSLKRAGL